MSSFDVLAATLPVSDPLEPKLATARSLSFDQARTTAENILTFPSRFSRSDIWRALSLSEFVPYYQPQFSLAADDSVELVGAEALVRWRHPSLGVLSPHTFFDSLTRTRLACHVSDYMAWVAVKQARLWREYISWSPEISVNVLPAQLESDAFVTNFLKALRVWNVPAHQMTIEIVESPNITDMQFVKKMLGQLRDEGVRIAIDDFGTGCASFDYLLKLPWDTVKICKEFVNGIGVNREAEEICTAVINLAASLSKRVVAEGVESASQLQFLRQHGCTVMQGFLLGVPVDSRTFASKHMRPKAMPGDESA